MGQAVFTSTVPNTAHTTEGWRKRGKGVPDITPYVVFGRDCWQMGGEKTGELLLLLDTQKCFTYSLRALMTLPISRSATNAETLSSLPERSFALSHGDRLHGTTLVLESWQDEKSLCGVGVTHFSVPKMLVLLTRKIPTYSEGFQCFLSFINSSSCLLPHHSVLLIRTSCILCHHLTTSSQQPNSSWKLEKTLGSKWCLCHLRKAPSASVAPCSAARLHMQVVGWMDFPCDSKQFSFTVQRCALITKGCIN